jgi:hypothetical protein
MASFFLLWKNFRAGLKIKIPYSKIDINKFLNIVWKDNKSNFSKSNIFISLTSK